MYQITLRDRTLAHLYRYRGIDRLIDIGAPFEITQDGIGMALGISRSHASIILSRMAEKGEVCIGHSSIKHGISPAKRNIYFLTDHGELEFHRLVESLDEEALGQLKTPPNINDCSIDDMRALSPADRDSIGSLLLIRRKVNRKDLPRHDIPLLVFDPKGNLYLRDHVRERFCSTADKDTMRRWHSLAADWWIDHGNDVRERLYHLTMAGRTYEAAKLVTANGYPLMDRPDRSSLDMILELNRRCMDPNIAKIAVRMALSLNRLDDGQMLLKSIYEYDECAAGALEAELLLKRGDKRKALDVACDCYDEGPETGMALGMCLLETGNYRDASSYLRKTRASLIEAGCLFRMDELLMMESKAALGQDRILEARKMLEAASEITLNDSRRAMIAPSLAAMDARIRRLYSS